MRIVESQGCIQQQKKIRNATWEKEGQILTSFDSGVVWPVPRGMDE